VTAREVLHDAHRDEHQATQYGDRQQDPDRGPGQVDPEVAQPVGPGPGEATDHRDRDDDADRRGQEVLDREAGELDQVAHRDLRYVRLPVGVRDERRGGVERRPRLDPGQPVGQRQVGLQPLDEVEQDHADGREGDHRPGVDRPGLLGLGVDPQQLVGDTLDPGVLVGCIDPSHVAAQRPVDSGQERDQKADLQQAGRGV
jgi:hypothetical protein